MSLTDFDRHLIADCLEGRETAWVEFSGRFLGLVSHVVSHSAAQKSLVLSTHDHEDLVADVFLAIIHNDYAVLRKFRGESSLATYLAVIARRVVVRQLSSNSPRAETLRHDPPERLSPNGAPTQEEVKGLLDQLDGKERDLVRMFYLEEKSYEEIGEKLGIPINSIGPTLSRARARIRHSEQQLAGH